MIETNTAVRRFAALAQATRLEVLKMLINAGPKGKTAGNLSDCAGVPPSTLSFHLRELQEAGFIHAARDGRHIRYSAAPVALTDLVQYLMAEVVTQPDSTTSPAPSGLAAE